MFARVTRFRIPKDRIEDDIRVSRETISQAVKNIPGSVGSYYLVDRERGETMAMVLWPDEQTLLRTEAEAKSIRESSTSAVEGEVISVEHFEVVLQPSDVMAGTRH